MNDAPARPQDVDSHKGGQGGVKPVPASLDRQQHAQRHHDGRDDIQIQMLAIGHQSRRARAAAIVDQDIGPNGIQDRSRGVDQKTLKGRVQHLRVGPTSPGLMQDRQRRHDDHDAFQNGREQLCLVMPVRMVGISGQRRHANGHQGCNGCHHIDRVLQRIRQQSHRARHSPSQQFQAQNHKAQDNAADPEFDDFGHGRPLNTWAQEVPLTNLCPVDQAAWPPSTPPHKPQSLLSA